MVRMPRSLWTGLALLAVAWGPVAAQQQPTYRCASKSGVTYTEKPCPGGRELGGGTRRATDKAAPPPQDRATIARRSTLSPEARQECKALDGSMRTQKAQIKALGTGATLQDEMPLVHNQKRYREIGC